MLKSERLGKICSTKKILFGVDLFPIVGFKCQFKSFLLNLFRNVTNFSTLFMIISYVFFITFQYHFFY